MDHRVSFKVYYEDTDSLGVVYYANYLKFMERGRSEFFAAAGADVAALNRAGYHIVVHSMNITFRRSAALGEVLDVVSSFRVASGFRGVFHQRLERGGELITDAEVEVVALDADQQLISLPPVIQALADA